MLLGGHFYIAANIRGEGILQPPLHLCGGTDRPGREDGARHLQRPRRVAGALAPLRDAPHPGH